ATAASDASATVDSSYFSIGYAQADASAVIDVLDGSTITANGPINVTSSGNASATATTKTSREQQALVGGASAVPFAASLGVSNATLTSTTTAAQTATIHGGRTVTVRALGDVESEAESESGLFADGNAAIALGLQFSTANVVTTIAGTVTADMNTNGG